jgi:hypothetical protein
MNPPCPPARLAAIEAIRDLLTQAEWAADPDTAIEHLSGVPNAIRVLTTAINGERQVTVMAPCDDDSPYCGPCGSWHPMPRDFAHAQALMCFDPKWKARAVPAEGPIAELVERLGLTRSVDGDDNTAEWRTSDAQLWVWEGADTGRWYADLTSGWDAGTEYPSEDAALRAYARAKGVA